MIIKGAKMTRVGFFFQVRKDKKEEYKKNHAKVWPEVVEVLRKNGWKNYSIFMREDGLLFGYFETNHASFAEAQAALAGNETLAKWGRFNAPLFEGIDDNQVALEEVFHMD